MNKSILSEVLHAPSYPARVHAAWKAATDLVATANIANQPAPYTAYRLILAHAKHGPRDTRLLPLDVWRIVVDALHVTQSRVAHAN
jgi:hypothetical protein